MMWNKKQKTTAPNDSSSSKPYVLYALVVIILAVLADVGLNIDPNQNAQSVNQVGKTEEPTGLQVRPLGDIKVDTTAVPTATPTASPKGSQNTPVPKAIAATPKPVTPTTSTYSKGICTTTPIPKKTIYQNASWIDAGKTGNGSDGLDGYIYKCTADSNGNHASEFTAQPINAIILVGTRQSTPQPAPTVTQQTPASQYTYDEAYRNCRAMIPSGGSAVEDCVRRLMHTYPY